MSVVDITTGELRPAYSEVKQSVQAARESGSKFFEQIVWQIENRAWEVLGYESWDAMRKAEYGDMGVVVPPADRPEILARMRRTGMTHRDISETVGVPETTVRRDLNRQMADEPAPTIVNSRGQERPASYSRQATKEELSAKYADQFPALAFFRDRGQHERVNALGRDLASMDATEQSERLEILDKTIAHEKRVESGESPSLDERVKARASTATDAPEPSEYFRSRQATERDREERERGRREANKVYAEAIYRLGENDPENFIAHFLPHHNRHVSEYMQFSVDRIDRAIDFLTALRKAIQK